VIRPSLVVVVHESRLDVVRIENARRQSVVRSDLSHLPARRRRSLGLHLTSIASGRSTIARILRVAGIPPSRPRPMTWRTFVHPHWPALVAADFFTTEVLRRNSRCDAF